MLSVMWASPPDLFVRTYVAVGRVKARGAPLSRNGSLDGSVLPDPRANATRGG
jgi:hypothetical protein